MSEGQLGRAMTLSELREATNDAGFVSTIVGVELDDLIDSDVETLNDLASQWVTGSVSGLTDISFELAGISDCEVLVRVTGRVEWDAL